MPFKTYYLTPEGILRRELNEQQVRAAFESKKGLLWVDVEGTTEGDIDFLARAFDFHHLALEDCLSTQIHAPKIDDFGDHLFIIVHGIDYTSVSKVVETTELFVFLGPHFVVSGHHVPLHSVQSIVELAEEDGRVMSRGPDFLAHALIDALVDNVLPTVDRMSDITDDIEEEAIRGPRQSTLEAVLQLKRSTMQIHRVMAPQREIMNRLSGGRLSVVTEEAQIFYRDIYDHIVRIEDLNQTLRERADSALTTYLSSVSIQQNETMKVLSMVASIFLPLTLLAGIYGMNFENMPELGWSWSYFAVLGFMGTAAAAALSWFWARRWITWGRRQVSRIRPLAVESAKLIGYLGHLGRRPGIE